LDSLPLLVFLAVLAVPSRVVGVSPTALLVRSWRSNTPQPIPTTAAVEEMISVAKGMVEIFRWTEDRWRHTFDAVGLRT
jgi:hypothetical protein